MKTLNKFYPIILVLLLTIFSADAVTFSRLSAKTVFNTSGYKSEQDFMKFLLKYFRQKPDLYRDANGLSPEEFRSEFPDEVKKTLKTADEVCNRTFVFRHDWDMEKTNIPYHFATGIDWKKIPFGDEEWCFMLNRHAYWVDLGRAYFLTRNEKYAREWVDQATDWIRKNPVDDSASGMLIWRRIEAGIRCENWIKAFGYFKNSPAVTPGFLSLFLNSLYEHAGFIDRTFSGFSATSNWGVLEFQGLYNVALFMPEFKKAAQWREDALKHLQTCAALQVFPDGAQWEDSPMYHNEVLHCFLNVCLISKRAGVKLPDAFINITANMAMADVKWQQPDFHQPLSGDSDDTDLRGILTLSAWLFGDAALKSRAYPTCDFATCFLLSNKELSDYRNEKSTDPGFTSVYLGNSGNMIMRSGWKPDDNYLLFRMQRNGCGHTHDDLLHISLFAHGKNYLVDGGRYTYVDSNERKELKSCFAHNSLVVDDSMNSTYNDSWSDRNNAYSRNRLSIIRSDIDYSQADNFAYMRLQNPVLMTRRILYIKPALWLIFDSFDTNGTHHFSQFFHFGESPVENNEEGISISKGMDKLLIQPINPVSVTLSESRWSPEYNLLKRNKMAECYREATGFTSFISAVYFPERDKVQVVKIPVYDRNNQPCHDKNVEAVKIRYNSHDYIFLVSYQPIDNFTPFFKVNNVFVKGHVVLLKYENAIPVQEVLVD